MALYRYVVLFRDNTANFLIMSCHLQICKSPECSAILSLKCQGSQFFSFDWHAHDLLWFAKYFFTLTSRGLTDRGAVQTKIQLPRIYPDDLLIKDLLHDKDGSRISNENVAIAFPRKDPVANYESGSLLWAHYGLDDSDDCLRY